MEAMTPIDPRVEMFQKGGQADSFFNMKALAPRPMSSATVFDTDFEDDDNSEIEDDSPISPRFSLNSMARRSETTLSSFEEVHTPIAEEEFHHGFNFGLQQMQMGKKSIEGPRGPHLFRSSVDSTYNNENEEILGMSPMTPRPSAHQLAAYDAPQVPQIPLQHQAPYQRPHTPPEFLDLTKVELWTPEQVATWMYDAGFEESIVEKFEENDISGAILTTLKFEDLRELDIPSFGTRTRLWNEIHVLRDSAPNTPKPATPIEEIASPCAETQMPTEFQRPSRSQSRNEGCPQPQQRKQSKRRPRNDVITPLESVSIVGIEQLMPKPHKCAKGENCAKWRKQERLRKNFNNEHPVSPEGYIWMAGDPGNALTAGAIANTIRPVSDAVPSVVASSDVMGPSPPQFRALEEENLRNMGQRDPQDNVKQFLQFQHIEPSWTSEQPPTPPYEMFPTLPAPHNNLRSLPRLAIPPPRPVVQGQAQVQQHSLPPRSASANGFAPYPMERGEALSPDLRNGNMSPAGAAGSVYRFGTPFSEMDVPVTAVPLGPVAREASQSVPPNMNYRTGGPPTIARSMSRSSARRPSFAAMPRVDEYLQSVAMQRNIHPNQSQTSIAPPVSMNNRYTPQRGGSPQQTQQQSQAPPKPAASSTSPVRTGDETTHAGPMKKRKTKMLRHEWHEHHFTLKGTRLAMHKDATAAETLEYIDVDDYAIACSSLASGSKLNAAFKAMSISRSSKNSWDGTGSSKKDETAFAFQLIPAALEKGQKIKKRESMLPGGGIDAGKSGKTHYFAVRSRDDRIDWMRELMLAKALKQKSEGFEINVNGNMI